MRTIWTAERDAQLLALWPDHSATELGLQLGKTRNAIIARVHRLKQTQFACVKLRRLRREIREHRRQLTNEIIETALRGGVARNLAIVLAQQNGSAYADIALAVGLSRQRVRQIVAKGILKRSATQYTRNSGQAA